MSKNAPSYAYSIIFGFAILALIITTLLISFEHLNLQKIILEATIYSFVGFSVGLLWPLGSWRWGLWLSIPIVSLIKLSILFAGNTNIYWEKDLLLLLTIIASGFLGGLLGLYFRCKSQNGKNSNGNKIKIIDIFFP